MNPPFVSGEAEVLASDSKLDILSINPAELHAAVQKDGKLIANIAEYHTPRSYSYETRMNFVNHDLADLVRANYTDDELAHLDRHLTDKDTTSVPILRGYTVIVDGVERELAMVTATQTGAEGANHGEMSSMLYLRDQVQAASAMMELFLQDPNTYAEQGQTAKELLLSALHLMSTPVQLDRFQNVIQMGNEASQEDWPHISLWFNDLDGIEPNNWRNKQDSFQMLAHLTLDAVDRGFLKSDELADGHKQFLASIVPLLESVDFPNYESSGSWEEITAKRSSVIAVETAMLHKMKALVDGNPEMSFLADGYDGDFSQALDTMVDKGLRQLGQYLPNESPGHAHNSVKYREADAALAYVLMYDLPQLLAERRIPMKINDGEPMTAEAIECEVLGKIKTLIDDTLHGAARYEPDSYLRADFGTNVGRLICTGVKRKVLKDAMSNSGEIDLDEKQRLRNELMPKGRQAAWSHPIAQIASWAAIRSISLQEHDPARAGHYRDLSTHFLNAVLSTVTGENQYYVALDANNEYRVMPVPANKIPEAYVTYTMPDGTELHVPSPHTPLNWAAAETARAVGLLRIATRQSIKNRS